MGLGTNQTRNWGVEQQSIALRITLRKKRVAYEVRKGRLFVAMTNGRITLPFNCAFAELVNVQRGRWHALHPWDHRLLATGVSQRDVVRATIEAVCL